MAICDKNLVLEYLKQIDSESSETLLNEISYNLAMILCLFSGQRKQSIAALDIDHMELTENISTYFSFRNIKNYSPRASFGANNIEALLNKPLCLPGDVGANIPS